MAPDYDTELPAGTAAKNNGSAASAEGNHVNDTGAAIESWTGADGKDITPDSAYPDNKNFLFQNWRCGPATIPHDLDIMNVLLQGYERFGGIEPGDFIKLYYPNNGNAFWPADNGFKAKTNIQTGVLETNRLVDRFGKEWGHFVGYMGLAFAQRSLPPSNLEFLTIPLQTLHTDKYLDDPNNDGYRVYCVDKEIAVQQGFIAPWFQQPEGGWQSMFTDQKDKIDRNTGEPMKDPRTGKTLQEPITIKDLVDSGHLRRLTWKEIEDHYKNILDKLQEKKRDLISAGTAPAMVDPLKMANAAAADVLRSSGLSVPYVLQRMLSS